MSERTARSVRVLGVVGVVFGLATLVSGGKALFGGGAPEGVVPFVLWFNFLAAFAYLAAGAGLFGGKRWAPPLAIGIAIGTALVFLAFGVHVASGGAFMPRTVGAMALRTGFWAVAGWVGCAKLGCRRATAQAG